MATRVKLEWFDQLPCSVTVCDRKYRILYLNDRSAEINAKEGGQRLVGKDLLACHPPEAKRKLRQVMASGRPNIYTIERAGVHKIIYQDHWRKNGVRRGLVEITFELPKKVPHFVRD